MTLAAPRITQPTTPAPSLEVEVIALRGAQRGGEHERALARATTLLGDYPENRDLHLIAASALRHLGRINEALTQLDRLAALQPGFAPLYQERGLAHIVRRDAPAAIAALCQAVAINPALPMAWRMLEGVYRLTGDAANAEAAAAQSAAIATLPPPVLKATALFADGDVKPAETMIRAFLLEHGDHPEAMRLLARIALHHEALDDAETLLAGVVAMVPDHTAARFDYTQTLIKRQKFREAESEIARLRNLDPANHDYRITEGTIEVGLGRHAAAIALYRDLIAERPGDADLYLWLGHALKTIGELEAAIAAYRDGIAARPAFGDAWWSLANLKTYRFSDADIAAMKRHEADPATPPIDRLHLCFALGKALEDAGEPALSWHFYAQGNAQRRAESHYRAEIFETNTAEQKRICTPAFFAARAGWGAPARDPIFIVGLPRAGSTLIEQILASHAHVEGTQELPDVQRIAIALNGRDPDYDNPCYPAALVDLDAEAVRAYGERYIADTRVFRELGRPRFIDKMPNNFRHIGLIHLILPNATIIDARREPMACCFSNLKQLFAQGQEFSYSVDDIARYYRTYLDLMRHWDRVLPGRVLRVIHEDVIDDLEGQVRRLLAHCDLTFDPACLAFHKTARAVRTPSSEQVRRPIYRDGLDQWRRFEPFLDDLKAALGDALDSWRA